MAGYKQSTQLNEKDSLQDMLNIEKEVVKLYTTALTEADGAKVRSAFKTSWETATNDQFGVYRLMKKSGYYQPAVADKAVIDRQKDTFSKVVGDLNG
ncbi:MAG: spore coat protein [Clostridia bacterium]|nr:spore coat protein [Clostridia bacterium]